MGVVVVRIHLSYELKGNQVEHRNDQSWFFSKPDSDGRNAIREISEVDLERLLVVLAHILNAVLVHWDLVALISVVSDELVELSTNPL